jgi:hypothetical protein
VSAECLGQTLNIQKLNMGYEDCLEETAPLEISIGTSDDEKIKKMKSRKKTMKKKQMVHYLSF